MSELIDLILLGRTRDARVLAEIDTEQISVEATGPDRLFPADIALRRGHCDLVAQFLRLGGPISSQPPLSVDLLRCYLEYLSRVYFGSARSVSLANSVWDQLYEGSRIFFERQDPQFSMAESEKKDMAWLVEQCRIYDREKFITVADGSGV